MMVKDRYKGARRVGKGLKIVGAGEYHPRIILRGSVVERLCGPAAE
jgi:hypothetical protein